MLTVEQIEEWNRAGGPAVELGNRGEQATPTPTILQEAQAVVFGPRQGAYGHPRDDFERIAILWDAYLDAKYSGLDTFTIVREDVSDMMILLKLARLMETPDHRDSIVDIAGYAETHARVVGLDG